MAENCKNNCGCVGYAYVPWQYLDKILCAEEALENGSVFPELILSINEYGKVCKQIGGSVIG